MDAALNQLLKSTSRTFYLTLRMFPAGIRAQCGLAYLLARTADTIADTEIIPVDRRLSGLEFLREQIVEVHRKPADFGDFAKQQGKPEERMLLERCDESLEALDSFNSA